MRDPFLRHCALKYLIRSLKYLIRSPLILNEAQLKKNCISTVDIICQNLESYGRIWRRSGRL